MNRTYARVYHTIPDDPRFERVYGNDAALAQWLRMLLVADAMYPASAPMPHRNSAVRLLIEVGLVEERSGNRYVLHGLEAERERRAASARNAAAVRWHSEGTANDMPSKAEQSITKKSNGASHANASFMGFAPKAGSHVGQHPDCQVCAPLRKSA